MASVTFDHVTKRFRDVSVIEDLTLEVPDQEFLILVGPSGCGKTTVLRMLAGLETVTAGNIYIGDRLVNDVSAKDRNIAMVFQSYALYPHMSIYDNLAFGLSLRRLPKPEIQRRVRDVAQILEIEELLRRKPGALSGGQRQRVALGRAIVRDPAVFLMDEPLSNLDAKLRVQTRAELVRLHERLQTTIIYVTHDQMEAMTMGSRIAVLNEGVIQQLDAPQNLYNDPANLFVAGFIGSPAMNLLDGELVQADGTICCRIGDILLSFHEQQVEAAAMHMRKPVVLGVRPEHIREADPPGAGNNRVKAKIDVVEPLGNETFLYLVLPDAPQQPVVIARAGPDTHVKSGQEIDVEFEMARAHLFEKDSGRAIV